NVDVLLVDDVQFLTNRKEMQSELLRLTEALQVGGHQIVLTSDRPPPEVADLDERLISRLSGGLVVDIGSPDYETRVAILRRKAEERGAKFEPGVLETVAGAESGNVRELMGALNRLVAFQAVNDRSINAETAKQLLGIGSEGADGGKAAARGGGGGAQGARRRRAAPGAVGGVSARGVCGGAVQRSRGGRRARGAQAAGQERQSARAGGEARSREAPPAQRERPRARPRQ